ncbi:hypothetical protein T4B_1677 [Trichinella pseudospiralis]|uniref:Uncharacterized protein n=1 Tax=Trichinella pseudospiralis TaxID=6337 RepID=A0A0V1H660_TRIPS|nr:hypothetical protein T4B_1677 [Trichinella pseudospiralis]
MPVASAAVTAVNGVNAPRGSNTEAASRRSPRLVPCVSEVACDGGQIDSWSSWGNPKRFPKSRTIDT